MAERCDVVVIGAGVVGLSVARALAMAGREVVVLERHDIIGFETSSRNSEVIHAGIYYPPGSVKAELCVRGKTLLYDYCERHQVPFERTGKVIVATRKDQFDVLRKYQHQARINGAGELSWLEGSDVERLEPALRCVAGIFSPNTGIIDSHAFMLSLQGDLEAHGGVVSLLTNVTDVRLDREQLMIRCGDFDLSADVLVNSAGLEAPQLARDFGIQHHGYYAKGHYYALSGPSPFGHLVYPIAETGGLGVHVTLDLAGQARFGPDVAWVEEPSYDFDSTNLERFIIAIREYYPDLAAERLHASYTGIRPKLAPAGGLATDFVIEGPAEHKIEGLVNLLGIESPGLTAALAIADRVHEIVG
jgi:L-2-hydroxyglutarate oxidase LhgO